MELEELNRSYGVPILYKPFLTTENHDPEFLESEAQEDPPRGILKKPSEESRNPEAIPDEQPGVQDHPPPFPNTNRYTPNPIDPDFKALINSILR